MEITADVRLKGNIWRETITQLSPSIFKTYWDIYSVCVGIGIMYDKQLEFEITKEEVQPLYVPRTKLWENAEILDYMFQAAILSSKLTDYNEDERLELAFNDEKKVDFNKITFLTKFANFGVTKLHELIGIDALETMDNIYSFLSSSVEGKNFEIDPLNDMLSEVSKDDIDKT